MSFTKAPESEDNVQPSGCGSMATADTNRSSCDDAGGSVVGGAKKERSVQHTQNDSDVEERSSWIGCKETNLYNKKCVLGKTVLKFSFHVVFS